MFMRSLSKNSLLCLNKDKHLSNQLTPYLPSVQLQHRNGGHVTESPRFREIWHNTDSIDSLYDLCKKPRTEFRYDPTRRAHYYLMMAGLYGAGFSAARNIIGTVIAYASPPATVVAAQSTEISLADIPEGKCTVILVGGDPVFVWHRNEAQIRKAQEQDNEAMRDPEKDDDRCEKPEWLIVSAVCTHFGCVPVFGQGSFNGFYCPCHGSHYDASARIRKGPAPKNLPIAKYQFTNSGTCLLTKRE